MRRIAAVTVNHNTSGYTELLLRSLFATHPPAGELGMSLTVLDNASEDDTARLRAYAAEVGVPVLPSGFTTHTKHNSHGHILRDFVLGHPEATHCLFLDTDAVFFQPNAIGTMANELDAAPDDVFAIGARIASSYEPDKDKVVEPEAIASHYERRVHPYCALFRNTPLFRRAAEQLGFSEVIYRWADRGEFIDTNQLITTAMRVFGYRHILSSAKVAHFFAVSYDYFGKERLVELAKHREVLLAAIRDGGPVAAPAGSDDRTEMVLVYEIVTARFWPRTASRDATTGGPTP